MTNVRRKLLAAASAIALTVGLCAGSGVNAEVVVRGIEGKPLEEVRPAPAFFKPDLASGSHQECLQGRALQRPDASVQCE